MFELISDTILLFLILDPLGNLPIFMSILKNVNQKKRNSIIFKEMLLALICMLFFLFIGDYILSLLSLRTETISISGGIILFLISIQMIFSENNKEIKEISELNNKEPFLVPLAIPLVAGPSILATLMLLSHKYPTKINYLFISLIISWSLSVIILMLSNFLLKILGKNGINALEKLMGLLLIMISAQMILDGLRAYLHT